MSNGERLFLFPSHLVLTTHRERAMTKMPSRPLDKKGATIKYTRRESRVELRIVSRANVRGINFFNIAVVVCHENVSRLSFFFAFFCVYTLLDVLCYSCGRGLKGFGNK